MKLAPQLFRGLTAFLTLNLTLLAPVFAQVWKPLPLVRQDILDAGFAGGEGCQRPQVIAVDSTDGSTVYYGTDVGGVFRSTNGGQSFSPANIGLETTGVVGVAVDPRNKNRAILIGDGGGNYFNKYGGVYLTTDQGATWSRKLSKQLNAVSTSSTRQNGREQVAFSLSSYNSTVGYCEVVYWISQGDLEPVSSAVGAALVDPNGSLYRSTNGGTSWTKFAEDSVYGGGDTADSLIKVHPTLGYIYIANKNGFYRYRNATEGWVQILPGSVRSLDVVASQPNNVWISIGSTLYKSTNSGDSFLPVTGTGIANIFHLKISPANPLYMLAMNSSTWNRYYTLNGGTDWTLSADNNALSWIPSSIFDENRSTLSYWHPTDSNIVWSLGKGDQLYRSVNKGATFSWASNGISGIANVSSFNFAVADPEVAYMGFLDFNSAITANQGRTWSFINLGINHPTDTDAFGWVFGGYAKNASVIFGGNQAFINNARSSEYELWITENGGVSSRKEADNLTGIQVSYEDPQNTATLATSVFFCWSLRSADGGQNWAPMVNCKGVFTHSTASGTLYGANGATVVKSIDRGVTWTNVSTLPSSVTDISVDPALGRLYVAAGQNLYKCDSSNGFAAVEITAIQGCPIRSVSVDPNNTAIVYGAGSFGTFRKIDNSAIRSVDSGVTWTKLNNRTDLGADGANCAEWVRVNPSSSDAWFTTNCYGMWRFTQPDIFPSVDGEVRRTGAGDGAGTVANLTATSLYLGVPDNTFTSSPVYAFQLPDVGAVTNPYTSATFSVGLAVSSSTFNGFYADVYGLTARTAPDLLVGDAFAGANDTTGATKIQDNWINFNGSTTVPTGIKTVSNAALVSYINAQYAGGAGAGKYIFIRISPDAGGNTFKNLRFASLEYTTDTTFRPRLILD